MNNLLSVSIVIPTLNSARTLKTCLDSISKQNYPFDLVEIIFADGGSRDSTLEIIEEFKGENKNFIVKIVANRLKTGEAGKAAALKASANEIIAFVDSDNILDGKDWLKRMTEPFFDADIIAAEPIRYTYRKIDGYITRYCALMGMNDPLCYFFGNYDRECLLSGHWTEMPYQVVADKESYLKLQLNAKRLPTIGANGFLIRSWGFKQLSVEDYLFDIDILAELLLKNPSLCVAKVRVGIVHVFSSSWRVFYLKQKRRIADYKFFMQNKMRSYSWSKLNRIGLIYFCLSCLALAPLLFQSIKGYSRRRDVCWFAHPLLCLVTFYVYLAGCLFSGNKIQKRDKWQI